MSRTVLFLCPHHAAKSIIAEVYFNRLAQKQNLNMVADSAGTEPDDAVSPAVASMLLTEGIDVSTRKPRLVSAEEIRMAHRIISMGCEPAEIGASPERVEQWSDVPFAGQDLPAARDAIRAHVEELVAELQSETAGSPA